MTEKSVKDIEVGLFFMISTVEKFIPCRPRWIILQVLPYSLVCKLEISDRIVCVLWCVVFSK